MLAKQNRSRIEFFQVDLDEALRQRLRLELAVREAASAEAFTLEYQPKVDLADGGVDGVEALIRWRHPEHGAVSPAVFIPIAEDIGLIGEIGDWVLRECCRQALRFREEGHAVSVAANVSARQLLAGDLPERVV